MMRLVIGLVLLGLVSAVWVFGTIKGYDEKVFVSKETMDIIQQTVMVTAEHRVELERSRRISDEIAFGALGLLAGAVIAACSGRYSNQGNLIKATIVGAVLGLLTGASAGYIGHAFQGNVALVENSTVHSVLRLIAMFLPFAIAMGFASALSGVLKRDLSDAMVSAILGLLIAGTIYGLASDANPASREQETHILPLHLQNKILLSTFVPMLISLMIAAQMLRKPKEAQPAAA